jgi:hypothetical protein
MGVIGSFIALALACFAAWGTHIVVCIKTGQYLLLIAGAIAFPVGIVHGFGIWFHFWY